MADDVGLAGAGPVQRELPAQEPAQVGDRGRGEAHVGAVAQVGDADTALVGLAGVGPDDRLVEARGPALPDRAEPVDHEVVPDVVPAPGVLVVGLDRPEHGRDLGGRVVVAVHRVVDDRPGQAVGGVDRSPVGRRTPVRPRAHRWDRVATRLGGRGYRFGRLGDGSAAGHVLVPHQVHGDGAGPRGQADLEGLTGPDPDRVTGRAIGLASGGVGSVVGVGPRLDQGEPTGPAAIDPYPHASGGVGRRRVAGTDHGERGGGVAAHLAGRGALGAGPVGLDRLDRDGDALHRGLVTGPRRARRRRRAPGGGADRGEEGDGGDGQDQEATDSNHGGCSVRQGKVAGRLFPRRSTGG